LEYNRQSMQNKAGEVTHSVTSHNQKQQHTQCKRQTQKPANRPQEVVHCKPKTTTNRQQNNPTALQPAKAYFWKT
jgi:hypothetical protein